MMMQPKEKRTFITQCFRVILPKSIMISGSPQSHIPEILKYPVSSIIYIERDPELVNYEKSVVDKFRGKAVIVNKDAYRYISNSNEQVDVIIMLIPPPSTLLLNRYYTH